MNAPRPSIFRYRRVFAISPMIQLSYRAQTVIEIFLTASRVFLFYVLWSAVYGPGQVSGGMTVGQAITYSTLATLLMARRWPVDSIADRVRDGRIVYMFLRPLSLHGYYWAQAVGSIWYRLFWLFVGGVIGLAAGIVSPPAGLQVTAAALFSVLLAEVVYCSFELFVQLSAFWTIEIQNVEFLYFFVLQLLSGAFVPIWYFPQWAQRVLALTPFTAALSTPLSLYVGRIGLSQALPTIFAQLAWCGVLLAFGQLVWSRAERRVVAQGG